MVVRLTAEHATAMAEGRCGWWSGDVLMGEGSRDYWWVSVGLRSWQVSELFFTNVSKRKKERKKDRLINITTLPSHVFTIFNVFSKFSAIF